MNKVYKFVLGILALTLILVLGKERLNASSTGTNDKDIYFYNWGDYVDPEVLKDFEEETGYNVIYETFDSNEAMMAKIEQGKTYYDVAFPSEYTVEMMRDKGLLEKLDHSKIVGLDNIDQRFLNQSYDPGNEYSIPYFWGTFGIIYNAEKYSEADVDSWANLWDPKFEGEILSFDGARETLGIGLLKKGYSLNEKNEKILREVKNDLVPFMSNVKALLADEIRMYMGQGEADIGITFSGEAAMAQDMNENLAYHIPKEGSNIWFDTMVIPKTSRNRKGAYALISYFLRPDIAARNADYVWYATPNKKAMDLIDEEAREDKTLYPDDEIIDKLEVFKDLGKETTILYNDLFLDLKIAPQAD